MIPILYNATETAFTSEGLGRLSDAISCVVTEERNGQYELFMEYPVTGALFDQLKHSAVIAAVPADGKSPQPFRIYRIEKPISGVCSIYAEHISYQLNSIPVMPFTASGIVNALNGLVTNAAEDCPFTVWTNKETAGTYTVKEPTAFRALLGGQEGSILDVFGTGEYEFDKWAVKLYLHRGTDNGVSIRYGKNLVDINQDENIQNTYTGVCPFWLDEETGNIVTLPEKVIWSSNADNFPYKRTRVISFNERFETAPTVAQLRTAAQQYITANNIGIPSVNLEVSYIDLHSITGLALERVSLCDTVTVVFETLGVSATAEVIKTEYDVLKDRYEKVTIGDAKSTIGEIIDNTVEQVVSENIDNEVTQLMKYVENQTALITGGLGGYVVINQNADGYPNEILIMDTPDKETAVNVIRMNQNGIGFSTNGYDGPFSTAWTIDGVFNASFIGAGRMDGAYIKANTISAAHMTIGDPTNYVTVIEQYPSSMLDADNPLGATVITASGYVSKGAASNHVLGMSDILANGFAYGDELYYEFDAYAPSAKTVRLAVIGYDAEKNELERFYSAPISITTTSKRFTGSLSMDYAHIDGDGNLVLPMASVNGDTLNLTYGQVTGDTLSFANYMNLWEYYAVVLLDDTSSQLYFSKAVIRKKYGGDLIVSGAISADKIMLGAVSEGKLASSVSNKINGAVSSSANALTAATNAVNTAFGAQTTANTAQSTAESAQSQSVIAKAAADAVAATMEEITKIEDNVTYIDGGKIYTNSIAARSIATNAVTSDKIAANAIVAGKIASGAVTADMITTGILTDSTGDNTWNLNTGAMSFKNLSWTATNSSMSAAGKLTCNGADITGNVTLTGPSGSYSGRTSVSVDLSKSYVPTSSGASATSDDPCVSFKLRTAQSPSTISAKKTLRLAGTLTEFIGAPNRYWRFVMSHLEDGGDYDLDAASTLTKGTKFLEEISSGGYTRECRNLTLSTQFFSEKFSPNKYYFITNKADALTNGYHVSSASTTESGVYGIALDASSGTTGGVLVKGGTNYLKITSSLHQINGSTIQFTSSSSRRYKHDIQSLDADHDPHKLLDLPVVQFVYNDGHPLQYADMDGQTLPGIIAEDVDKHYPSAVIHDADGNVESWDERRILPAMLALIQEQQQRLDEQEKRIEKLEAMLKELIENG